MIFFCFAYQNIYNKLKASEAAYYIGSSDCGTKFMCAIKRVLMKGR